MKAVSQFGFHRDFENYRDLLLVLLEKEMKVRYKNQVLGYFWSIANPLSHALIYFFAFKIMMRLNVENYALFLIAGVFPWQWMTNTVASSPKMFLGNNLIKKLNFPKIIIPLATVLNHLIHFLLSVPVIVLFLFAHGDAPSLSWLVIGPLLIIIQLMMSLGVCLVVSSLNLFLRDIERLVNILMHFAFYLTPILYPVDTIPDGYKPFLLLHPFAPLFLSWREMFIHGTVHWPYIVSASIYGVIFLAIGYLVFRSLSWKFAEVS